MSLIVVQDSSCLLKALNILFDCPIMLICCLESWNCAVRNAYKNLWLLNYNKRAITSSLTLDECTNSDIMKNYIPSSSTLRPSSSETFYTIGFYSS
jgi:hypothetical protein